MSNFKTFTVYRTGDLSETHDENQRPASPDTPAYWGVVFPDETCVLRWSGAVRSHSVWASFDDAMKVHGHPEPRYGTKLVWNETDTLINPDCVFWVHDKDQTDTWYSYCPKCGEKL